MPEFLHALPPLQALAVCALGPVVGTLAVTFFIAEAAGFVRLAFRRNLP